MRGEHVALEQAVLHGRRTRERRIGVIDGPHLERRLVLVGGRDEDHLRRVEAARVVLEVLPLPAVLDGAPGGDGPVVAELPVDRAHAARHRAAEVLHARLDGHRLLHLREVVHVLRRLREAEVAHHRAEDVLVAVRALLVVVEVGRGGVELVGRDVGERRLDGRVALEAELAAEARADRVVVVERLVAEPHAPVVHVAGRVVLPPVAEVARPEARRTRPERARGIAFAADRVQLLRARGAEPHVLRAHLLVAVEPLRRADALVVAAPERDRRVVAQVLHLVADLAAHAGEEVLVARIGGAGEHEVVPDHDAELVAGLVERGMLELAAAPHAHHVHVGRLRVAEQLAVVAVLPVLERVARNPVRALAEDALAVHGDRHLAALLAVHGVGRGVHVVDHLELAEADAARDRRLAERRAEVVERLVARAVRPPEARTVHLQRERHLVRAARERHAAGGGRLADPHGEVHLARVRRERLGGDLDLNGGVVGRELLHGVHVVEAGVVDRDELDRAHEAGVHLRDAPVPAAVALHGAHEVDLLHGRVGDVERAGVVVRLRVGDVFRRVEARADLVRAGAQELLHVEVVALEAVAGLADLLPVHVDVREAVDVLEPQPHGLLRRERRGHVERAREVPLDAARPLGELLVLRPVRVGDELRLVERGVDAAGHRHGTRHRVRLRLRERPRAREVDLRRVCGARGAHRQNYSQSLHLYLLLL